MTFIFYFFGFLYFFSVSHFLKKYKVKLNAPFYFSPPNPMIFPIISNKFTKTSKDWPKEKDKVVSI